MTGGSRRKESSSLLSHERKIQECKENIAKKQKYVEKLKVAIAESEKEKAELEKEFMKHDFTYDFEKDALRTVLTGRFTRMGQLIKTDVLQKAGGADERVFIQDESIPLRAALYAHGIVKIHDNVVLVPKELGNFSGNKIQLDNDRFMAYCYMLLDNPQLQEDIRKKLYMRALSAYWKFVKKTSPLPYLKPIFFKYLTSKVYPQSPNIEYLKKMQTVFLGLSGVRRIKN